eukprot:TRINITY_DN42672_c0_g2_i1.p1 TRINITY_DN42672_c0_g2~~TRINITY_DN42672_c0_g2_i1.p1  ORF type:complete len:561 (+),score=97.21 TRINITY_DN42672_c0_g2_i1:57-1739(+)
MSSQASGRRRRRTRSGGASQGQVDRSGHDVVDAEAIAEIHMADVVDCPSRTAPAALDVEAGNTADFVPPGFVVSPQSALCQDEVVPVEVKGGGNCEAPEAAAVVPPSVEDGEIPGSAASSAKAGKLVLGRYQVDQEQLLGEGGWCVVYRGLDIRAPPEQAQRGVAIKTYNAQAIRDTDDAALCERFARELGTFQRLGISRAHESDVAFARSRSGGSILGPQQLFVNLIDFSHADDSGKSMQPSRASDGYFYSVLELADESLESCLDRRRKAADFFTLSRLRDLARSLAAGLAWMHSRNLCHLDIKPANVMCFGDRWKLIDLEGAVPLSAMPPAKVDLASVTPLYAPPELAKAVLADPEIVASGTGVLNLEANGRMDTWAAGVVLLDALAHQCAFQDTWSGFQMQAMMSFDEDEGGLGFKKDWYEWLADPAALRLEDYLGDCAAGLALLSESSELRELLTGLLEKEPCKRFTAEELLRQPFLALEQQLPLSVAPATGPPVATETAALENEEPEPTNVEKTEENLITTADLKPPPLPAQRKSPGILQRCCVVFCGKKVPAEE